MPVPLIAGLLAFLTGWFARFLGSAALRIIVFKALAWLLVTAVLPTVLYNLFSYILGQMLTLVSGYMADAGLTAFSYEFTGLAAWFADKLKVLQAFSIVFSAMILRATLNLIPFVGRL